MSDQQSSDGVVNRRNLLKGAAGVGVLGAGLLAMGFGTNRNTARATVTGLTASDVTITSNDGQVSTLTIEPEFTIDWSDFETPVDGMLIDIEAQTEGGNGGYVVGHYPQISTASTQGSVTTQTPVLELLSANGGVIDRSALADTTEGDGPTSTVVELTFTVHFEDANNNDILTKTVTETFTVNVTNEAETTTVSVTANTNGS